MEPRDESRWYLVTLPLHPENPYWWTEAAAVNRDLALELRAHGYLVIGPHPPADPNAELQEVYESEINRGMQRTKKKAWFEAD